MGRQDRGKEGRKEGRKEGKKDVSDYYSELL